MNTKNSLFCINSSATDAGDDARASCAGEYEKSVVKL